jgi:hypothetical protein
MGGRKNVLVSTAGLSILVIEMLEQKGFFTVWELKG